MLSSTSEPFTIYRTFVVCKEVPDGAWSSRHSFVLLMGQFADFELTLSVGTLEITSALLPTMHEIRKYISICCLQVWFPTIIRHYHLVGPQGSEIFRCQSGIARSKSEL